MTSFSGPRQHEDKHRIVLKKGEWQHDSQAPGDAAGEGPQTPWGLDACDRWSGLGVGARGGPAGQPGQLQGARDEPLHWVSDGEGLGKLHGRILLRGVPLSLKRYRALNWIYIFLRPKNKHWNKSFHSQVLFDFILNTSHLSHVRWLSQFTWTFQLPQHVLLVSYKSCDERISFSNGVIRTFRNRDALSKTTSITFW